jgi:Ferredoxin subunits of nitrite reductase and ring-hydroxylating dioxygenases
MSELYAICQNGEIEDGQGTGFTLMRLDEGGEPQPWSILITRKGNNFYGFENKCPHQGEKLDTQPGNFMDEEGNFLTCGHHGAQFDLDTGECFIGPCQGRKLTPISIVIDDGDVCVTDVQLAEDDGLDMADPDEAPEVMITSD